MKIYFGDGDVYGVDEFGNTFFRASIADFDPTEETLLFEEEKGKGGDKSENYDDLCDQLIANGGFTEEEMKGYLGLQRITKSRKLKMYKQGIVCLSVAPDGKVYQFQGKDTGAEEVPAKSVDSVESHWD